MADQESTYSSFAGDQLIVSAELPAMLLATKAVLDQQPPAGVLIFEDQTGRQIDFDFRGTPDDVLARAQVGPGARGRGVPSSASCRAK